MRKPNKKKKNKKNETENHSLEKIQEPITEQSKNNLYEVKTSEKMGRYLVASKNFNSGDEIISELPFVIGPISGADYGIICLGCYSPLEEYHGCKLCKISLCKNCPGFHQPLGHSEMECEAFKKISKKYETFQEEYCAIVPFRCLLLKINSQQWESLQNMQAQNEVRRNLSDLWQTNQEQIVDRIRNKWGFNEYTEEEIHTVCGILEVNAFEVTRGDVHLRALYSTTFLLAHNCVPNASHADDPTTFTLTIRAAVPINAGEQITLSYANTLEGTFQRRKSLLQNKFFHCECKRCMDSTELGTCISALLCPKCMDGVVLSENPLDSSSDWTCWNRANSKKKHKNKCSGYSMSSEAMEKLIERIKAEIMKISCNDINGYETFLDKYAKVLHSNHYLNLHVKHNLSQLYGKIEGFMIHELSNEALNRKIEICRSILQIFDVIEPGFTRIRGITFYELHAPLMTLTARDFHLKRITKPELSKRLKEIVKCLTEAQKILSLEPKATSVGRIAEAAVVALNEINKWKN